MRPHRLSPTGTTLCPKTAKALNPILEPTYAFGPPPSYSKVDPSTGYLPATFAWGEMPALPVVEK
jgi:hypothetical protein